MSPKCISSGRTRSLAAIAFSLRGSPSNYYAYSYVECLLRNSAGARDAVGRKLSRISLLSEVSLANSAARAQAVSLSHLLRDRDLCPPRTSLVVMLLLRSSGQTSRLFFQCWSLSGRSTRRAQTGGTRRQGAAQQRTPPVYAVSGLPSSANFVRTYRSPVSTTSFFSWAYPILRRSAFFYSPGIVCTGTLFSRGT